MKIVLQMAIESSLIHRIYLTKLVQEFDCDIFFPEFDKSQYKLVKDPDVPEGEQVEGEINYEFQVYEKI